MPAAVFCILRFVAAFLPRSANWEGCPPPQAPLPFGVIEPRGLSIGLTQPVPASTGPAGGPELSHGSAIFTYFVLKPSPPFLSQGCHIAAHQMFGWGVRLEGARCFLLRWEPKSSNADAQAFKLIATTLRLVPAKSAVKVRLQT